MAPVLTTPRWGAAQPARGRNYVDLALAFGRDFPVGTLLDSTDLDRWAAQHKVYTLPPTSEKHSDAWVAHIQRRRRFRTSLNKAATHPRMNEPGAPGAYYLGFAAPHHRAQFYKVQSPLDSIAEHEITVRTTSLVSGKRRELQYLLQSQDWTLLPAYERVFVETLFDDITHYERCVKDDGDDLDKKFRRLRTRLDAALQAGLPAPADGALRQLLRRTRREGS